MEPGPRSADLETAAGSDRDLRDLLANALARPLPGRRAHRLAWPDHLPDRPDPEGGAYRQAAVLIALHHGPEGIRFPLIRRPEAMRRHAGQISLPGGECDAAEEPAACALREAEEEIGLDRAAVQVLGLLTPVPVSVSGYVITPVVGWVETIAPPAWVAHACEVDAIFPADPDLLLAEGPRGHVLRDREGVRLEVPAYLVPDAAALHVTVWGATAIILAEFLEVWRTVREGANP